MPQVDNGVLDGDGQPLHQVFQLADVPGPVIPLQKGQEPGAEGEIFLILPAEPGQKLVGQGEHILPPLAQGRDVDADDVEPVEEVGAEKAPLDRLFQIAVGGHQKAEIQLDPLVAGEAFDGLLLNELEQLGLDVGGQLANLVQKEGAVVGQLDFSDFAAAGGPGEGPLLIAEQLRLNEIFVEHGAVDLDKRPVGPAAHGVDGLGHGAFPHAGLPGDENVGLGVGGVLHQGPQPLHGGAFEDESGGGGPGAKLRNLLSVLLEGVLKVAVVPLDGVDLLHGDGVEADGEFQLPPPVEEGDAHGHDVFV